MHVAVAIVAYRNPHDIVRCLAALARSTHQDYEVIICENGGEQAFNELCAVLPPALVNGQAVRVVLASANLGYAGGVNVCLRETPAADAWWVLNPDTEPYPEAMAAQVARLALGDCEAVGCTIHLPDGRVQSHGGRWRRWLGRAESMGYGTSLDRPIDPAKIERCQSYLNGASMLISRRFVEIVGPMREDYFLYCEEVEWCLRGLARGMRLGFAVEARVLHHQGTTTGNAQQIRLRSRAPIYLNERNKIVVTRDRFPAYLPVAAAVGFVTLFARYARRGAWRQLLYGLDGWRSGLMNERGAPSWIAP